MEGPARRPGDQSTATLSQTVFVPYGCEATVGFWLRVVTREETDSLAPDTLTVRANGVSLATYSNLDASAGYVRKTLDLGPLAGQYVTLTFTSVEDLAVPTYFMIDDTEFTLHP